MSWLRHPLRPAILRITVLLLCTNCRSACLTACPVSAESPPDMPRLHLLPVDPVPALHRPLLAYLLAGALDMSSDLFIACCGFRRLRVGAMSFWVRRAEPLSPSASARKQQREEEEPPLVFVHGVGLGLVTYLPFLAVPPLASPHTGAAGAAARVHEAEHRGLLPRHPADR